VAATIVTYEIILLQFSAIHADERDLMAHSVAKRYCLWCKDTSVYLGYQ